jgi:hypothetical protein
MTGENLEALLHVWMDVRHDPAVRIDPELHPEHLDPALDRALEPVSLADYRILD